MDGGKEKRGGKRAYEIGERKGKEGVDFEERWVRLLRERLARRTRARTYARGYVIRRRARRGATDDDTFFGEKPRDPGVST